MMLQELRSCVNKTWISGNSCPGTDRGDVRKDMGGMKKGGPGCIIASEAILPICWWLKIRNTG